MISSRISWRCFNHSIQCSISLLKRLDGYCLLSLTAPTVSIQREFQKYENKLRKTNFFLDFQHGSERPGACGFSGKAGRDCDLKIL